MGYRFVAKQVGGTKITGESAVSVMNAAERVLETDDEQYSTLP